MGHTNSTSNKNTCSYKGCTSKITIIDQARGKHDLCAFHKCQWSRNGDRCNFPICNKLSNVCINHKCSSCNLPRRACATGGLYYYCFTCQEKEFLKEQKDKSEEDKTS